MESAGPKDITVVVVMPTEIPAFERTLDQLRNIGVEVLLLNTHAPEEVTPGATQSGFVIHSDPDRHFVDATTRLVASGRLSGQLALIFGKAKLHEGWLERARSAQTPTCLEDRALVTISSHDIDQLGPLCSEGLLPFVAKDDEELYVGDLEFLLAQAKSGRTAVGELPIVAAERLRERLQLEEERRLLLITRGDSDVCWPEDGEAEPLVTVRIPTYNRGELILDRAIASILRQTYERFELLVIGDSCDEATERAVKSVKDSRVRFVNLPTRGLYPREPGLSRLVAGVPPVNFALDVATGSWIAPCDDDDEFVDNHIEVLLKAALDNRLEMVWSRARMETPDGWQTIGAAPPTPGNVAHGSVMYSSGLRFLKMSNTCWKMNERASYNYWRRMSAIGVKMGFTDEITYRHYAGRRFREHMPAGPREMA